ncbi:hypothetical protein EBB07_28780 [Paenibacillaceae bacterium]|nr:hypothetical protein EBB07_28780 [Paenibacillaceae bacterium]
MKPTEKQAAYVARIINQLGEERVQKYIQHFYSSATIDNLKKHEAQKVITGLQTYLPLKHWGGNGMSMGWIQSQ